jgi:hypothetical protein
LGWTARLTIESHVAAEAALIQLGNRLGYETYTADSGKSFQYGRLSDIANLRNLPRFPSEEIDRSAKLIDVIWVKDGWPEFFFEVEHSTNIKSGLQRMFQALKLDAKFFIVAPGSRRTRFDLAIKEAGSADRRVCGLRLFMRRQIRVLGSEGILNRPPVQSVRRPRPHLVAYGRKTVPGKTESNTVFLSRLEIGIGRAGNRSPYPDLIFMQRREAGHFLALGLQCGSIGGQGYG